MLHQNDQRRSEPMAGRWARNDVGDSDDDGEPKSSAGRRLQDVVRPRTETPQSVGFDDGWKAGTRNVIESGFEPDEFEALPPFLRSRQTITMPDTGPPRRSSFLSLQFPFCVASCCTGGS